MVIFGHFCKRDEILTNLKKCSFFRACIPSILGAQEENSMKKDEAITLDQALIMALKMYFAKRICQNRKLKMTIMQRKLKNTATWN